MTDDIAIKVENVSKTFKLPHEKHSTIKSALINFGRSKKGYEKQQVLSNISFEIKEGEFFGIVGRNGSGKSTLLKLLAGIYTPDKGNIKINGKLTPFIELGVGFNHELSGRENIFLNGALLGFSRKEMEAMYDDIVEFAELERFMDQKLKNYSSGMQVRLAFSIAIQAKSEILVLDEVLAVGDEAFQQKCNEYFAQLRREKRTVVLVSHSMEAIKRFCTQAILLDRGVILKSGPSNDIAELYSEINEPTDSDRHSKASTKRGGSQYKDVLVETVMHNEKGEHTRSFKQGEDIYINLDIAVVKDIQNPVIGLTIERSNHETIFWTTTEELHSQLLNKRLKAKSKLNVVCKIQNVFGADSYIVDIAIMSQDRLVTYFREDEAADFVVRSNISKGWLLHPNHEISVKTLNK